MDYEALVDVNRSVPSHITTIELDPEKLKDLTEDNFQSHSGLGFDIRNRSQLSAFVSNLFSIKAKVENLLLMSFDNEDLMNCQRWNIKVMFDFVQSSTVQLTKEAEYIRIKCDPTWSDLIYYFEEEVEFKFNQRVQFILSRKDTSSASSRLSPTLPLIIS